MTYSPSPTLILLFLTTTSFPQFALRIDFPLGKFSGKDISETSYLLSFNFIENLAPQFYIPMGEKEHFVLMTEIGGCVLGTKQGNNKERVWGIYNGWYVKYNILDPEMTPYIIAGIKLDLLFKNSLNLSLKNDNNPVSAGNWNHRILFPEIVAGIGFSFFHGLLSIDIRDHYGLITIIPDKKVYSNTVSIGIIGHLRN